MKVYSRPLPLCITGAVWPLVVMPLTILIYLKAYDVSDSSLPAIIILVVASLGIFPFGYGLYTFFRRSWSQTVAILFSVTISAISYWLYAMVLIYYTLFSIAFLD
jgi:hypothetical protein